MFAKTNSLKELEDASSASTTAPLLCLFPAPGHSEPSNKAQQLTEQSAERQSKLTLFSTENSSLAKRNCSDRNK